MVSMGTLRSNTKDNGLPLSLPAASSYRSGVNYRDDERRGLDVGVTPATLVREVVAGTPSIMGG